MVPSHVRTSAWALLLVLGGISVADRSAARAQAEPKAASTPRELFVAQCATCHGESGDGKGPTVLDRPSRSFLAGGFSYGNTPEAVLRTITFGIPGSRMPSFESALGEADRKALAAYVIALGPPELRVAPGESVMVVRERAVVVRGKLPALEDGGPEIPRGLLVGLPSGLSFEYDAGDLRLVAVRSGEFVDRTDWQGRGGTALRPLGQIVRRVVTDSKPLQIERRRPGESIRPQVRLRSVSIEGDRVRIQTELFATPVEGSSALPRSLGMATETLEAFTATVGAGWKREFHFELASESTLWCELPRTGAELRAWGDEVSCSCRASSSGSDYDITVARFRPEARGSFPVGLEDGFSFPVNSKRSAWTIVEIPGAKLDADPGTRWEQISKLAKEVP